MPTAAAAKVSVLIPCYNLGEFLDEAVESVLAQTYKNFEILVVDDGSTEPATQALLAQYERPRTRVIRAAHGGVSAARNLAIAHTDGAYLCALDADDRLEPTYFEKAVARLDADPSIAFVSCWLRTFGDAEWEWKPEQCDLPGLLWEDTVLTAALMRREPVVAAGGYDVGMPAQGAEDWDLALSLVGLGYRGSILREVLFNYRRRAGSLSTASWFGSQHLPLTSYLISKHWTMYQKHLSDVLVHQDDQTASLLRRNDELERYIGSELEPWIARRQQELAKLRSRLSTATTTTTETRPEQELQQALAEARAEVDALHASASWRLTAPLRMLYDVWFRLRNPQ
jgi:glycosyltransferase involved in cell wall biosynthesis